MSRRLPIIFGLFLCAPSIGSDYGTTGLIDIPTARMAQDGTLTATAAIQSRTNSYAITYQAAPWFEGTFRYTGFNDWFYYDRNYEAKVRLWQEQDYLPQVAVGIRDIVGTGFFGSEYLVASKTVGDFDFTLGMGWGRLAGDGYLRNPFALLSSQFEDRTITTGSAPDPTGQFQPGLWFSGEEIGIFGGVHFQPDSLPVSLMLEYNPDQYDGAFFKGVPRPESPVSAAIKWEALPGVALTFSRQHNQGWGIELSAALDTKAAPPRRQAPRFRSSLDIPKDQLPSVLSRGDWYDMLLFDVERSGLILVEANINRLSRTAQLVIGNKQYSLWADAVAKMTTLADLHLPESVNTFRFIIEEEGHRVHSVQIRRPSKAYGQNRELMARQIGILPGRSLEGPRRETNFVRKKVVFDINLATRFQFFDPDDPARYQLYGEVGARVALPNKWVLIGAYGQDITHNFDESSRVETDSVLQPVRSDIVKYLTEGDSGLDSLYLEKRGNARNDVYYRLYGGVLETMYSGVGAEVLYQPFQSRVAYGLSGNWVRQRDYDKSFDHLDYQTTTGFASVYWASPFYNIDVAVHAGKYLAKDVGATLEIRRTFNNGWMVGLWATKTDVSAEDFGEGSFDKGMFFRIPFDSLFGRNTRSGYATNVRPIQRDGGQRLEDFSGNIWWNIRGARYDALSEMTDRMVP